MKLFNNTKFFTTVNDLNHLPNTNKEIAFVGRSNSGKSSAINTITNQKRLAFVSKQPGRTQHINYFELNNDIFLVDLPGYGYAQVPESIRKHWVDLLGNYLATRKELIGLIMIMDIRHPLKELDKKMLDFIVYRKLPVHILLSKADKLSRQEQVNSIKFVQNSLLSWNKKTEVSIQLFSSLKKTGIDDIERVITSWII